VDQNFCFGLYRITEFYQLWDKGVSGRVPVRDLLIGERAGQGRSYYLWKNAAAAIEKQATSSGLSPEMVATQLETDRQKLGKGVSTFVKGLVKLSVAGR